MKRKRFLSVILVVCSIICILGGLKTSDAVQAAIDTPDLVVVLDPGHDSRHGGAEYYGYKEHEVVYKIAQYCKAELEQYNGVKVYMTRTSNQCPCDKKVSSKECNEWRVDYAQEVNADIYVSFHLDALEKGTASGATIYYPNSNYRPEFGTQGKELATNILTELNNIGISKNKDGLKIWNSENNTKYPDGSLADYLAVIKGAKLRGYPSVLIEHLYLSNQNEVNTFLNTDDKLKKIGVADATGIVKYLGLSMTASVRQAEDGNWYYYSGEVIDESYTGLAKSEHEWLYVKGGKVDFTVNDVVYYKGEWWNIRDGKVDVTFDGVGTNGNGTWYIEDGKVDFNKSGVLHRGNKWYLFESGCVNRTNTVAHNSNGWWYIKNGEVDFSYDGIGINGNGTWYIENGKVDFSKSGVLHRGNGWYYFKGGQVQKVTTVANNSNGWWYIRNGEVDFSANTVAQNSNGWWYIKDGKVDFSYDGIGTNGNGTWYIEDGKVDFSKSGVLHRGNDWYYFKGGQVQKVTTVANNSNGWWYIKDGKVDFGYNGLGINENGTWYIENGKVNFGFNGVYTDQDGKQYNIVNGKVS